MSTPLMELKDRIVSSVDVRQFYRDEVGIRAFGKSGARISCFHPDHHDPKPSLTINEDGSFKCFGCGIKGSSIVQAYEYIHEVDFPTALRELAEKYLGQHLVPDRKVELWHNALLGNEEKLEFLSNTRGADKELVKRLRLGWNGIQFTIPITDASGLVVNVRKYNPQSKQRKIVSYKKGFGEARLWPMSALNAKDVILCEGEPDVICGMAHGLNVITSTGGASHWKDSWDALFKGHNVVIVPDIDKAGIQWGTMVGHRLLEVADSVKVVKLTGLEKKEKDLTDFLMRLSVKDFKDLVNGTDYLVRNVSPAQALAEEAQPTTLAEASKSELYFRRTFMDCVVSGKELSPYLAPTKVRVDCKGGRDMCEMCHRKPKGFTDTLEFDLATDRVLRLVDVSDSQIEHVMREVGNIPESCPIQVHHLEKANVERVTLSPGIEEQGIANIAATGYYLGHGIETNRPYRVQSFLLPEPRRQRAVHIITDANSVYDVLDNYSPSGTELDELRRFQLEDVSAGLSEYYESELPKVTGIYGRPLMHQAIDLVYHSSLGFTFNNEEIRRGWLETLIFGDTQQGKTNAAYNLVRHYRLGDIATGEASTFAGLVGGLQKINDRWAVSWGLLARHDRRLVFIDEVSGLSTSDIERMSRVRSEGKAELVKVVSQVANARCRLIWLGNPRTGGHLDSYSLGTDAIRELVGKNEDISRFDFVITMARGEVSDSVLNRKKPRRQTLKYSSDLERLLVVWCWSRKPAQITFTRGAQSAILTKHAPELSAEYSSEFPLVQKENIRVKLARTSAAVAGRCFRTPDGIKLVVDEQCVEEAVAFLRRTYEQPSLGYKMFTDQSVRSKTLRNEAELIKELKQYDTYDEMIEGLVEYNEIGVADIANFASIETWEAKELLGRLVRQRALVKKNGVYRKRPAFISLVNRLRAHPATSASRSSQHTSHGSAQSNGSAQPKKRSGK